MDVQHDIRTHALHFRAIFFLVSTGVEIMSCVLLPIGDTYMGRGLDEAEAVPMSILLIMCSARQMSMNEPQQGVGSKPLAGLSAACRLRTPPYP
jgi:hypothetical protein